MLYWVLRWIAGTGLRWYYRDIRVVGGERIPRTGPVIFAVNHPNALIDALVAASVVPRRIRLTGKATLFHNPLLGAFLRAVGVVPLRRASDERNRLEADASPVRNAESFRALGDVLAMGGAMLIFPEGKSHSAPSIAPLKTGIARIALETRDVRRVPGLLLVPLGLVFERKEEPRSRVLVQVGRPIAVDAFEASPDGDAVEGLTMLVEHGLRDVTLNFESPAHAERVLAVADVIAGITDELRTVDQAEPPVASLLDTIRRIENARLSLEARGEDSHASARVDVFLARLDAFQAGLHRLNLRVSDVGIEIGVAAGTRFAIREGTILAIVGPAAVWGRLNHWIPLRAARAIALAGATDRDQPAMRTVVAGLLLILLAYAAQTALVAWLAGPWIATAYLVTLPVFASWDLRLADRTERAAARVRAYFLFRRSPALHAALRAESEWLRSESAAIERLLASREALEATRGAGAPVPRDPSARPRGAHRSAGP